MRILSRYILKEVFSHSLLGLLIFTFVIFIRHTNQLLELVVRRSLPASTILTLFLLPVPGILVLTIPMSVLVGVLEWSAPGCRGLTSEWSAPGCRGPAAGKECR